MIARRKSRTIADMPFDYLYTNGQLKRDELINDLLEIYIKHYEEKRQTNCRQTIFMTLCTIVIFALTVVCCLSLYQLYQSISQDEISMQLCIVLIVLFLTTIIAILIIFKFSIKYIFFRKDETNILEFIKVVQENDLKNKYHNVESIK